MTIYCKSTNFGGYKIWRLPVNAVYDQRHFRMLAATNISENTQFAKYKSTPKFVDLQYRIQQYLLYIPVTPRRAWRTCPDRIWQAFP